MSLKDDYSFRKFLEVQDNKFGLILGVARQARELSEDYDDLILHSEAITHTVHGTKPRLKDITRWESEAFEIKDMFCSIEDVDVCNAVYDSFYASKAAGNLLYVYNNIENPYIRARVRILTRMLWDKLNMYYERTVSQTMAKRKKNEVVETPVEQEAVLEVEKVEGEALPEITEENINDIKESMITAIEADTKTDVVAESFIEDVGKVENQLPTAEELEVPVEKKAEKPKRTRKVATKKSETKKSEAKKPTTATSKEIKLDNLVWLYANSAIQTSNRTISGIVYLWDSKKVTGRYPVTTVADGAGKLGALSGWINAEDLGLE
jgi:hypothetical protein